MVGGLLSEPRIAWMDGMGELGWDDFERWEGCEARWFGLPWVCRQLVGRPQGFAPTGVISSPRLRDVGLDPSSLFQRLPALPDRGPDGRHLKGRRLPSLGLCPELVL